MKEKETKCITLGVSICLDVVSILTFQKPCLDMSRKSWHFKKVSLDFVSTSMSRPKSLHRDREIRRDLKILAFLDSLFGSRLRSAWILIFSCWDFSIRRDFSSFSDSKGLDNVEISQQILTISTRLDNLDKNLDASKSWVKSLNFKNLDREKKNWSWHFKKVSLDTKDVLDLDLDWSRLLRPPGL